MEKELVDLGLLTARQIKRQDPDNPAVKKYFMHGLGHPLGLDVHDSGLTTQPIQAGLGHDRRAGHLHSRRKAWPCGWKTTFTSLPTGPVDLMADIPIEPGEIESLMARRRRR